jgi:D-alanyl-D-alanine carboxypeptidase/D-alanyl-D-alanine-endopeptidase (penicillin-binding protein 4)
MPNFTLTWVLILSLLSPFVWAQSLSTKIDAIIAQQLPHATVAVLVKDAKTGQIIYRRNADKLLAPASSMKLLTAAAALYQLQPNYRFSTRLSQKGDNFYISFTGAPDFTRQNLKQLLSSLKKSAKILQGNIILDISRFKPPYYSGGVSYDDLGWYYAAPETAIIIDENAVTYELIPAKKLGKPIKIKAQASGQEINLINQVITVSKEQEKDHCSLNIALENNNSLRLFGCLAISDKPVIMQFAIPDPLFLAQQQIKAYLRQQFKGKLMMGQTPPDAKLIADCQSAELSQLVVHMLKQSDNLYANSLTRTLGYVISKEGTAKQGAFALRKIVAEHTQLDMTQVAIADGMGTRYNLISPEQMVNLLSEIYHDKTLYPLFLNALPQAGVSGTLQHRMEKTSLNKRVFAKTGTMHDISSLSGYLLSPGTSPIIFSIIINGINTPISTAKALEERILEIIHNTPKP